MRNSSRREECNARQAKYCKMGSDPAATRQEVLIFNKPMTDKSGHLRACAV